MGRVAPVLEEELFFRTEGRIRTVYIKRDDAVTAGQLLADFEIDDLERELASTKLELERNEQLLAQAEQQRLDDLAQANLQLAIAETRLAEAEQQRQDDLAAARIEVGLKEVTLRQTQNQDPALRETIVAVEFVKARIALEQAQLAYDEIAFGDDVGGQR